MRALFGLKGVRGIREGVPGKFGKVEITEDGAPWIYPLAFLENLGRIAKKAKPAF